MKSSSFDFGWVGGVIAFFIFGLFVAGWVMNIIEIFGSDFSQITGMLVIRVIGVFLAPIGAIVGWL